MGWGGLGKFGKVGEGVVEGGRGAIVTGLGRRGDVVERGVAGRKKIPIPGHEDGSSGRDRKMRGNATKKKSSLSRAKTRKDVNINKNNCAQWGKLRGQRRGQEQVRESGSAWRW